MKFKAYYIFLLALPFLGSCKSFRSSTLFETDKSINAGVFEQTLMSMQKSYTIQKNDLLAISAFPNNGEQLVDPTQDFPIGAAGSNTLRTVQRNTATGNNDMMGNTNFPINSNGESPQTYLVDMNGQVNIPILGYVTLEGLTLLQADSLLVEKFSSYMKSPYVITQYLNKRVVLMGALGDRIVPLRYENMSLYEVIAEGSQIGRGGVQNNVQSNLRDARVNEIRIIRNYASDNISVLNVDLSTVEGAMKLQTNIQPNDIIYIRPRRNFDGSTFSDISRIISPIATAFALVFTILTLSRD